MIKYAELTTKKAKIARIREQLETNDRWLIRGLVAVYNHQTASEQQAGDTAIHNGVGFTGTDGGFLSSIAERVIKAGAHKAAIDATQPFDISYYLTVNQVRETRRRMVKYATQLHSYTKKD